ncbi:hypothetical protein WKI71_11460 [Streptomyces sp. MS1.AVA.1]|uniref:Uncharacterized protein n=1 Tax=Streptomyces machairae TaxID=3134109 RepID=A0ABU8UJ07_9ACTN
MDPGPAQDGPAVVPLDQPGTALPWLLGSKAADPARAARAGLPVLPGIVIPYRAAGDTFALRRARTSSPTAAPALSSYGRPRRRRTRR